MSNSHRLSSGGRIDRARQINFKFNGKTYSGYEGDTLASALLANGVSLTARSFKYHRPRGIVGAGVEEPSSFVELLGDDSSANHQITTVRLKEGLEARSVNCWPSASFDLMSINQLFSRLLPAAFYYKTFMWPNWHLFEPSIRRAAGLASAPEKKPQSGRYETRHWHCDVLVAGAGPAGLVAALTAARSGARVLIADEGSEAGGSLLRQSVTINDRPAAEWIRQTTDELAAIENVTHLQDATVWAYRENNLVIVTERSPKQQNIRQRTWRVRAGHVVIAAGAIERSLVFPNNDRPGVMLMSAVSTYIHRYAVKPGDKAVVFTNNNSVYPVVAEMTAVGIEVAAAVDSRKVVSEQDVSVLANHVIAKVHGGRQVKGVTVKSKDDGAERYIACNLVCVSGGWNPAVHLHSQSRGTLRFDTHLATFVPDESAQASSCVGASAGCFGLAEAISSATETTQRIAQQLGFTYPIPEQIKTPAKPQYEIEHLWHVDQQRPTDKSFVDIQNDVTLNDIHLAIREGFGAVEHVKRYTTAGMGLDQGRTGNVNVIGAIANQTGATFEEIGTTTFRSPYTPVEFGALAGLREETVFLPYRHTPITRWNIDNGAVMYEAGARWRRPGYYPKPGESFQESVNRESLAVRNDSAVYDGSPLGKYEIKGPDSLKFIDMLYTNSFANLETGMGRYGLMLTDDGLILDDGVTFKLANNHYLMSTSTGHADDVNRHMEHFLQMERPDWNVMITPVTSQWSNATVCGPKAREVMQALETDIDLSNEAFPFMGMRHGIVADIPARVCRVSFTGELSFEINVAPRHALELWKKIIEAGEPFNLIPVGSESNHVLRVEKGFLSLGHEVDGTADPYDLGMSWVLSKKKHDYIGKRALEIRRSANKPRREMVGLLIDDSKRLVQEGAPITPEGKTVASEGLVTACVWSVVQNRSIALALLLDGRNRMEQTVYIRLKDEIVTAKVTSPCFHDPQGALLKG